MSSELLASGVDNLKGHLAGAFNVLTGSSGDYTDLGIGRKFGGAAGAYSLRDIGAMNGPVVRVRRDSDNSEQDFSALAVPFIPDWCNRQVVKPLDVKELQSDGRTGDFVIAKAAYSLRSLGDRQATVAATGDTVARANGKYVVQVRRSSDDTIKSFTADEVTDGTLVAFVGSGNDGFVRTWYDQSVTTQAGDTATGNHAVQTTADAQPKIVSSGSLNTDGGLLFDGTDDKLTIPNDIISSINSASAFLVAKSNTGSGARIALALSHSTSNFRFYVGALLSTKLHFGYQDTALKIEVGGADINTNKHLFTSIAGSSNAEAFLDGTSKGTVSSVDGKSTLSSGGIGSINTGNFWSGTIEEIVVHNTDQTDNRGAFEANIALHYAISGIPAEDSEVNGFVETWYDQSGNGRDITQTTASEQPKIVSSGALVTATNNLPAIDFTTSVTRLARAEFLTGQLSTYFSIYQGEAGDSSESQVVFRQGASYRLNNAIQTSGKIRAQIRDGGGDAVNLDAGGDLATGSPLLQTTLIGARGANGLTIFVNGANEANGDTSDIEDTDFAAADSGDFAIGGVYNSNSFDFVGKGQEFIFYHSNLSSDRTVIESNINNHYSIF